MFKSLNSGIVWLSNPWLMPCGFVVQLWAGGREEGFLLSLGFVLLFAVFSKFLHPQWKGRNKRDREGKFLTVFRTLQYARNENPVELSVVCASVRHWSQLLKLSSTLHLVVQARNPVINLESSLSFTSQHDQSPTFVASNFLNVSWITFTLPSYPSLLSDARAPLPELLQPSSNWPSQVLPLCYSICLKPPWLPTVHRTSSDFSTEYILHELPWGWPSWGRGCKERPKWTADLGHVKAFSHYLLSNRKSKTVSFK